MNKYKYQIYTNGFHSTIELADKTKYFNKQDVLLKVEKLLKENPDMEYYIKVNNQGEDYE